MLDNCSEKSSISSSTTNPWPQVVDKASLMASNGRVMEKPSIQEQQQPLKCPRCDSSNTKFCYYNNYSLSQPRHFCKACKRYWTRGGTLRNVPVGGGYRKNKKVKKPNGGSDHHSSSSSSLPTLTHTPLNPLQIDTSTTSHVNHLFYGLPNNPSYTNFPFQRFNSRNIENIPSSCNGYSHQSQLSGLGLSFPSSTMSTRDDQHDYGAGFNPNNHIQDLLTSSNSILSNLSLLGSSSSYGTNASLIASSLQKQKQVMSGLKETRPNTHFQALFPFEGLQMAGHGEAATMIKMEEEKDRNGSKMEWRVPCENHIEPIGSSDGSLYWNSTSSVGGWPDHLANYGSSVTPLI